MSPTAVRCAVAGICDKFAAGFGLTPASVYVWDEMRNHFIAYFYFGCREALG